MEKLEETETDGSLVMKDLTPKIICRKEKVKSSLGNKNRN